MLHVGWKHTFKHTGNFEQMYTPVGGLRKVNLLSSLCYSMKIILQLCIDEIKMFETKNIFADNTKLVRFLESNIYCTEDMTTGLETQYTFLDSLKDFPLWITQT